MALTNIKGEPMTDPADQPRPAESVPVQLTRIEGDIKLILDRTSTLTTRMDRVEDEVSAQAKTVQRLDLDAIARDKTAVALALALKEADETRRNKSETVWSPFAKTITAILCVVGVLSLYLQMKP